MGIPAPSAALLVTLTALAVGGVGVPAAGAATYTLRPDGDVVNGWLSSPGGPAWSQLDDPITQPTAPSPSSDYIYAWGNGPINTEVSLTTQPLGAGETVTRVRDWAYVGTGSNRSVTLQLRTGASVLAGVTIPSGQAAAWRYVEYNGSLTQAQIDNLRLHATLSGNGASTNSYIYTGYAELQTSLPPPPPSITASPPAAGSNPTPAWSFTVQAGLGTECRLDGPSGVVQNWTACVSPRSYDLNLYPDGAYTFSVRTKDSAGLTSTATTGSYTLDRVAPAAPTITSAPSSPSGSPAPSWSFTGEPGASFECRLNGAAWTACTSPQGYDLSGDPDGTSTFDVRAIDGAGNAGSPASSSYVLDRTVPSPPLVAISPGTTGSDRGPVFTFSAAGAASYECSWRGGAYGACSSGVQEDLSLAADGAYDLSVRGVSGLGTPGPATTATYTLDTTAPAPPSLTSGPAATTPSPDPEFAWTAESGATTWCEIRDGVGAVVIASAQCTSPATFHLTTDGDYVFAIHAVDGVGNAGAEATYAFTLDQTLPPAPSIDSAPTVGSSRSLSWTFTGSGAAGYECRLTGPGSVVVDGWGACSPGSPGYQYTLAPLAAEGDYVFEVRGLTGTTPAVAGPSASATYDYDVTAPAVPTFTSEPASPASDARPAWAFTGEAGATFECRLERGGVALADWASCTSPVAFDLSSSTDGTYDMRVRAVDAASNVGPDALSSFVLDTTGPAAPAFTAQPPAVGTGVRPSWSWSGEGGATYRCRLLLGGAVLVDWTACASGHSPDLSALPDGSYELVVEPSDAVGNTGVAATSGGYALDRTAPGGPAIDSGPAPVSSSRQPQWAFHAEGGSTACRLDGPAGVVSDWAPCDSPRAYDLAGQPDGTYTFRVRATDAAGNTGPEVTGVFTLDTAPGAVQVASGPPPAGTSRTPGWTFSSSEPGATFECRMLRDGVEVAGWSACTSPYQPDLAGQPDGTYHFAVRSLDAAGNPSAVAEVDYRLDTTPPTTPRITSSPDSPGADRTPRWSFTAEAGAALQCRVERGAVAVLDWTPCTSPFTADLADEPDGTHRFSVRAGDAVGNIGGSATDDYDLETPAGSTTKAAPQALRPPADTTTPRSDPAPAPARAPARTPDASTPLPVTPRPRPAAAPARRPARPSTTARRPRSAPRPAPAPRPRPAPPRPPSEHESALGKIASTAGEAAKAAARAVASAVVDHPDKSVFPASLIFIVLAFLSVQNRIDRADPKLALAPADPYVEFLDP